VFLPSAVCRGNSRTCCSGGFGPSYEIEIAFEISNFTFVMYGINDGDLYPISCIQTNLIDLRRMPSPVILLHVAFIGTDVSDEHNAAIITAT
jgi:hypothetical protein